MFKNRVAQLVAPRRFAVTDRVIDTVPDDKILVRNHVCGICQGTEIWFWKGIHCDTGEPLQYPVLLGHQNAGTVGAVGGQVEGFKVGDRVTGSGVKGYQLCSVADPRRCLRIPEGVTDEQATQAIELASIIKEVDRAGIRADDRVAIIGAGPMGNLLLQVVRLRCPQMIIVTDLHDSRLRLAQKMGASAVVNATQDDQVQRVRDLTGGATVVFEATTAIGCLKLAVEMLAVEGRLVVFGTHPEPVDLRPDVFKRKSCVVYYTFPTPTEWLTYGEKGLALLQTGAVDIASLISHRFGLEQIDDAFALLEQNPSDVMKVMIVPERQ